jgi:hypothetical protein
MKMKQTLVGMLALCSSLTLTNAYAADPVEIDEVPVVEEPAPSWTFAIDPLYTWLPGFKGDARVFGNDISMDITTGDILSNMGEFLHALDGLYMGSGEWRNGQFGLQYDIVYLALSGGSEFAPGFIQGGVDLGFRYSQTTLAGNYRVYEAPNAYLDVLGGIRITNVDLDLTIQINPAVLSASDGDTWVDPIVGLKGRYDLDDNWYVKGSAIYGGITSDGR